MLMRGDRDLELDFIREFAVGGDSGLGYGQAYQHCYGRPIEMRRTVKARTEV